MSGVCDYAVVYDITCNRERRHIDRLLKGFGFRVQKSVFECRLNRKARQELVDHLCRMEIKTGFVKIYRLEFSSKREVVGAAPKATCDAGNAFII